MRSSLHAGEMGPGPRRPEGCRRATGPRSIPARLACFVNKDALGGKPVPACWKDLRSPTIRGWSELSRSVLRLRWVCRDSGRDQSRRSAAPKRNFDPAIKFFRRPRGRHDPIVPKQTSHARVVSGDAAGSCSTTISTPIARNIQKRANFEFVIPGEGSVWCFPSVAGYSSRTPRTREKAKKVLDYLLSDKRGRRSWDQRLSPPGAADRPARERVKKKFLPDSDDACARQERRLGTDGKRTKGALSTAISPKSAEACDGASSPGRHRCLMPGLCLVYASLPLAGGDSGVLPVADDAARRDRGRRTRRGSAGISRDPDRAALPARRVCQHRPACHGDHSL